MTKLDYAAVGFGFVLSVYLAVTGSTLTYQVIGVVAGALVLGAGYLLHKVCSL